MTRPHCSILSVATLGMIFTCAGCATMTTGATQRVTIDSDPQNANVRVSTGFRGETPCSFELKRNQDHVIKISKEGYKTTLVTLRKTLCGSTAGNIILGGVVGVGVDAISGACFKLIPEKVVAKLDPGNINDIVNMNPSPPHINNIKKKDTELSANKK